MHYLKNFDTREVDTSKFTSSLFGPASAPFLLAGVIEHHLNGWSEKRPDIVGEIRKNLSADHLTSGGSSNVGAKEYKATAMEMFVDAAFELHEWHSDQPELESEVTEQNTIIGLRWDKQRDIVNIAVPSEKLERTKKEY